MLRFEPGDTDIDSNDDQPAKQFGDIEMEAHFKGSVARSSAVSWAMTPCGPSGATKKLEGGCDQYSGHVQFRDPADGVTLLRSTYAGAVVLPESRLPAHRDRSCRRAGVCRGGRRSVGNSLHEVAALLNVPLDTISEWHNSER